MLAAQRHVVGERVGREGAVARVAPGAALVVVHLAECDGGGQVLVVLARHLAGAATRAARAVEEKSVLSHVVLPPVRLS